MNDLLISLLVFALIFGGAAVGMVVRPLLSEHHLDSDCKDAVKLTSRLIGTLTALVLGLLIASAKGTFDQKASQVRHLIATIILLDELLSQYGAEAAGVRKLLRQSIPPLADRIWQERGLSTSNRFESTAQSAALEDQLEHLSPGNDAQRSLQSRAIQAFTDGAQTRLQLFAQTGGSIPTPFLVILVFWLSAIFLSVMLFARANVVVVASLLICALSFSCAIFLVLELDDPFAGLMGISSQTLRSALQPLDS